MRTRGTPRQLAAHFRRMARAMEQELRAGLREIGMEAEAVARQYSSGGYTTAMLKAMGHPYARAHPAPPQDPAILNKQTGLYRRSHRVRGPVREGDRLVVRVVNTAPYAKYFPRGTRRMIERPIAEAVRFIMWPRARKIMQAALRRAGRP